jgi:hypothetical protein
MPVENFGGSKSAWPWPPSSDIEQFQRVPAVETSGQILILDLKDVTLVNLDAVKFLLHCEADGIQLENCPLHVQRWIDQIKNRSTRRGVRRKSFLFRSLKISEMKQFVRRGSGQTRDARALAPGGFQQPDLDQLAQQCIAPL